MSTYSATIGQLCLFEFIFYLRKVWSVRDHVETSVLIELIRVLVLSRVDYCNSLYYGLPNFLLAKLQRIMNSAARLIFRLSPSNQPRCT